LRFYAKNPNNQTTNNKKITKKKISSSKPYDSAFVPCWILKLLHRHNANLDIAVWNM